MARLEHEMVQRETHWNNLAMIGVVTAALRTTERKKTARGQLWQSEVLRVVSTRAQRQGKAMGMAN